MSKDIEHDGYTVDVPLFEDDTLEDLQRSGFRLLQKKKGFRLCMDSVFLAAYAAFFYRTNIKKTICAVDLGAGCGAVSLLLAARLPGLHISGIEIDPDSGDAFQRNIILNNLQDRMKAIHGDIRFLFSEPRQTADLNPGSFDLVVSNPPYEQHQPNRRTTGVPVNQPKRRAREETELGLNDLVLAAAKLLRPGGRIVLVHQVRRLPELICSLRSVGLEAKTLRLIQSLPGKQPLTFLLSAVKQGRPGGFVTQPPLLVYTAPGILSPEANELYGSEPPLDAAALCKGLIRSSNQQLQETR